MQLTAPASFQPAYMQLLTNAAAVSVLAATDGVAWVQIPSYYVPAGSAAQPSVVALALPAGSAAGYAVWRVVVQALAPGSSRAMVDSATFYPSPTSQQTQWPSVGAGASPAFLAEGQYNFTATSNASTAWAAFGDASSPGWMGADGTYAMGAYAGAASTVIAGGTAARGACPRTLACDGQACGFMN